MSVAHDIAVVGGGPAGAALALALSQSGAGMRVVLLDAAERPRPSQDIRAYAIAPGTRRMLESLGIWPEIAGDAQPATAIEITDARAAEAIRPVLLSFSGEAGLGEPLAHFVQASRLVNATREKLEASDVRILQGARVTGLVQDPAGMRLTTSAGEMTAGLAVGADGARSAVRRLSRIRRVEFPYIQDAVVAVVASDVPHGGHAVQHFRAGGPLALLPLPQDRRGIVWSLPQAEARRLAASGASAFCERLMEEAGPEAGELSLVAGPLAHPLELAVAREFVKPRIALLGDAAHQVHPLAGQGLNLGYRDVAALAEVVVEAQRRGEDVGSRAVLERYQQWRRFDTVAFAATTDLLNRLFATDSGPLRTLRHAGLSAVDRLGGIKQRIMGEAAGEVGRLPRLMAGEAL